MKNKILTIDGLISFLESQNKTINFSSDESGADILLSSHGMFEVLEDKHSEGLMYCKVRAFHDLSNANKSYIDTEVLEENIQSMKDRPIMADIIETDETDEDGNFIKDFAGHTMIVDEKTGKTLYIEKPVGHFVNPKNFHIEYDKKYKRHFVVADCVVYDEYTDTCDILRRRKEVECSVELCIRDLAYDAKEKVLKLNDFYVQGCTLLGADVKAGMKGSKVTTTEFCDNENASFTQSDNDKLIDTLEKLTVVLEKFNIQAKAKESSKEGGKDEVTKFEELLTKYNKTEADITFEIDGLSDEELEAKFAEVFGEEEPTDVEPTSDDNNDSENADVESPVEEDEAIENAENENGEENINEENDNKEAGNVEDGEKSEEESETPKDDNSNDKEQNSDTENYTEVPKDNTIKYSVEVSGVINTYEVSLNDKIYALEKLVNATYSELDNCYYGVKAYDNYVIMVDYWTGNAYKQTYKADGDDFILAGDRVEVYATYVTAEEQAVLDEMKANYSVIEEKLKTYQDAEINAEKEAIISDVAYADFAESEEFKSIKSNISDISVDELRTMCELAFAKLVRSNGSFSLKDTAKEEKRKPNKIGINASFEANEEDEPYGDYFRSLAKRY